MEAHLFIYLYLQEKTSVSHGRHIQLNITAIAGL